MRYRNLCNSVTEGILSGGQSGSCRNEQPGACNCERCGAAQRRLEPLSDIFDVEAAPVAPNMTNARRKAGLTVRPPERVAGHSPCKCRPVDSDSHGAQAQADSLQGDPVCDFVKNRVAVPRGFGKQTRTMKPQDIAALARMLLPTMTHVQAQGPAPRPTLPSLKFKAPQRPTHLPGDGYEGPIPDHDGGGGGTIPDGFTPPGPWLFATNCNPVFKTAPYHEANNCSENNRVLIDAAHFSAYAIAVLSLRTVEYIRQHPEQYLLWLWGHPNPSPWHPKHYWGNRQSAIFASLGYWFGTYNIGPKLNRVRQVFSSLVAWFEHGGVNWTYHVGGWTRKPVTYRCPALFQCSAFHPDQRHTDLCVPFFYFTNLANHRRRAAEILHESMHSVVGSLNPRDEKLTSVCAFKASRPRWYCYANPNDNLNIPWTHGNTVNDPRSLIEYNRDDVALNNIDNYVSWALRRFDDPQWGFCDGPRPPTPTGFGLGPP